MISLELSGVCLGVDHSGDSPTSQLLFQSQRPRLLDEQRGQQRRDSSAGQFGRQNGTSPTVRVSEWATQLSD